MAKYTGPNTESFEKAVKAIQTIDDLEQYMMAVRRLAKEFGIDCNDIWDILPEYSDTDPCITEPYPARAGLDGGQA